MTRDEALAYFTPHPLTKGPVMLDPERMREAVAVLAGIGAHDPDIAGLELTEQICFDKVKRERDAYREALEPFAQEADRLNDMFDDETPYDPGDEDGVRFRQFRHARSLLSQSTEGE